VQMLCKVGVETHEYIYTCMSIYIHVMQMLCKVGGKPLLMLVDKNETSCLYIAAQEGHAAVVEVGAGGVRQREVGGRVSAATAHGTWCKGCRQHTATRGTTLQHTAARCYSVRSS